MNWISSIKDKSSKLVGQITKVGQPKNEESTLKSNDSGNQNAIELGEKANRIEFSDRERDYPALIEVLKPFLTRKVVYQERVEDAVSLVLSNPERYLKQNPNSLVLPSRTDFTNFTTFMERNRPNDEFLAKVLTFDPTLPRLLVTDDHMGHTKKENIIELIMRLVYVLIYLIETGRIEEERNKKFDSNKENEESDKDVINDKKDLDKLELVDRV